MIRGILQKTAAVLFIAGAFIALAGCSHDDDNSVFVCNPGCVDKDSIRECIGGEPVDSLCLNGCDTDHNVCF